MWELTVLPASFVLGKTASDLVAW